MHLKSYPKLVRSEVHLDAPGVQTASQRSSLFLSQQGGLLRTCSGNHGNISSSRLPFSVISTNTLRCTNATNCNSGVTSLRLKAPSNTALQLLPPTPGCENNSPGLYQTTAEDADAPLDIWAVIKPGHVREKIAIFASEEGRADGARASERTSTSGSSSRDRTPAVLVNHGAMTGLSRAVKAKGSWEENCSAKRRRRSGSNQNLQQDQRTQVQDTQQLALKPSSGSSDATHRSAGGRHDGEVMSAEEEEQKVSVVEIVAFMEQRANEQQPDSKPLLALQRSSTTITLSRALPLAVREGSEVKGEEPESIKVSDMVARLESECLRRRTEGDLSRNNSLRRTVGRVLLAAADHSSAPCQPSPPSSSLTSSVAPSSSSSPLPAALSREPISCLQTVRAEMPASALTTPPSPGLTTPLSGELVGKSQQVVGAVTETVAPRPSSEEAEPVPGLLFLTPSSTETDSDPPAVCPSSSNSASQSEKKRRRRKTDIVQTEEVVGVASPLIRRASASQDFLVMRQRLQQLLEPQPYLAVLPHHLLVKIFLLLPTQSLAALKCSCHYFKFIIENYGVRPADSLWVSDPRYRDDPCKQCKKRYCRGDVSLCRWHHKPYCQALPYGPGYWMCCHGAHRDAPGCNVGLHDNRWVPAFHSINVPIYRRSRNHDD
ncbi:F-box only protein 34 [Acanthochromis polyacanthus]|uniref:F-box protein 34 n=1 Tax=Acanthochromis polyacanthus TaxID=80966 RepID=A0A3Q1FJ09_9TELE|nr:F-box only protein 34 [Acanthochromis polyacanthus]